MHLLFVTGKLAEPALRRVVGELASQVGFDYSVAVLPITVVALASTEWIARHCTPASNVNRVVVPGLCPGNLDVLTSTWHGVEIQRGPNDLRELPESFGKPRQQDYGRYDIAILAEINHAPHLSVEELLTQARQAIADGADLIDLGCDPGATWTGIGEMVRRLRDEEIRVSVDTFNPKEVSAAVQAGAELVLSVNRENRNISADWGCEVVAVPDVPGTLDGLDATIDYLTNKKVPFRLDPILEPIGFGFANSLARYHETRGRYPQAEIMMGVGNLTELTDVDSAGINVVLSGYCQELGIRSVLTTEVINWARSSVRELDLARRLVYHAYTHRVLPKHVEPNLVMLRDPRLRAHGEQTLIELSEHITDHNVRIFAERGHLHVLSRRLRLTGEDPFALFAELSKTLDIDPSHAFYLGYEMAKAMTALTLSKNYTQDQALRWGFLTRDESTHRGE